MKELLKQKYEDLKELCGDTLQDSSDNINFIIQKSLKLFIEKCEKPAIWCYGNHTKMLMTDFIFELKKTRYVIDNGLAGTSEGGFKIISEKEIKEKGIDGIIISSKVYRDEIIKSIQSNYNNIPYLDIYTELEKAGICLKEEYYTGRHPYSRYVVLNKMQNNILFNEDEYALGLRKIVGKYIDMKDFRSAIFCAKKLNDVSSDIEDEKLLKKIEELYDLELKMINRINENNVVMLCIDGLRRKEVCEKYMKNMYDFLTNYTCFFCNAYSTSTSTYESLIPTYSENMDLRTKYYESNVVRENSCRFINEAKRQERNIYFYTDGTTYIEDEEIKVTRKFETATEKMWDFVLDAANEKNGLFYIHILYESHYSYPNPYTKSEIIAEGTNILFDYLDKNGRQIRIDYSVQQKDALRYLDDVVVPFIKKLKCRMVLFADHGNILFDRGTKIEEIEKSKYSYHEELIQVPLAIKAPEIATGCNQMLISIMELNDIIISLMNKQNIFLERHDYIKVVRSKIYNPDFIFLYKKVNYGHELLAFEVFVFKDGYKLAIYEDGVVELYLSADDARIHNNLLKRKLIKKVENEITVCNLQEIKK